MFNIGIGFIVCFALASLVAGFFLTHPRNKRDQ